MSIDRLSSDGEVVVVEEGDLRKYRIELPNLIDDLGLSPYACRLYLHIKRRAGARSDGYCEEGYRRMAKICRMSLTTVSRARQELEDAKLIEIERQASGRPHPERIRIVDIWTENFERYSGKKRFPDERLSVSETDEKAFLGDSKKRFPEKHMKKEHVCTKKEPKKKEPHTQRAAQASPSRVCVKENQAETLSRHSFETCERYAASQAKITNPGGWATQARRTGEYDKKIDEWLVTESDDSSSTFAISTRRDFDSSFTQRFLDAARPKLNNNSFLEWFEPLRCKQQGEQIIIYVPNKGFEQIIRSNYGDILEEILDELKLRDQEIVFVETSTGVAKNKICDQSGDRNSNSLIATLHAQRKMCVRLRNHFESAR